MQSHFSKAFNLHENFGGSADGFMCSCILFSTSLCPLATTTPCPFCTQYSRKPAIIRHTIENKIASHSQVLPPPSKSPLALSDLSLVVEGTYGSFEPLGPCYEHAAPHRYRCVLACCGCAWRGRRAGQPLGAWSNFIFLWRTYPPGTPLELRYSP
eukprot:1137327-Pelagomonas_calceolata.AAC.1